MPLDSETKYLLEEIKSDDPDTTEFQVWSLSEDDEINEVLTALASNSLLKVIDLSSCEIRDRHIPLLVDALANKDNLRELNLEGNYLGQSSQALQSLVDQLSKLPSLVTLKMNDNNVSESDFRHFKDMIETNFTLLTLDLGDARTPAGQATLKQISDMLITNELLTELEADNDAVAKPIERISDKELIAIINMFSSPSPNKRKMPEEERNPAPSPKRLATEVTQQGPSVRS